MNSLYAIASVFLVSVFSLVGIAGVALAKNNYEKIIFFLVSFAVGALFGDAFIHLIPEAFEQISQPLTVSLLIIGGVLLFFVLEKYIRWHHCHLEEGECQEHKNHLGAMNIFGDGAHNFIDGILIGAAYLVSIPVGVATTVAIILHEIPSEIGEFAVLLHSGMKVKKALLYNFLSASVAFLGLFLVLLLGQNFTEYVNYLLPVAAGGFVYIGGSDLIPELHHETNAKKSLLQLSAIILGVAIMIALLGME